MWGAASPTPADAETPGRGATPGGAAAASPVLLSPGGSAKRKLGSAEGGEPVPSPVPLADDAPPAEAAPAKKGRRAVIESDEDDD